jgi:methionine synthase II (cobalamin-independent)
MGSLLRPQALVDKRVAMDEKLAVEIARDDELHRIEDEAVEEIVKMQLEAGFHGVTDGE